MNASEQSLYDRICQFSFDDGDEDLTFSLRLARENGWTQTYAARVIDEYKRFIFLAVVADHPVTPSDQVDQVWHLHLTYTKSYWDKLCGQVLGAPLHHGPTRGGTEEADKFNRWYRNTLESYARCFGHEPPADIWPEPSVRFGHDLYFQRVNTKKNWVIRKPPSIRAAKNVVLGLLLILLVATLSLMIQSLSNGSNRWWVLGSYSEAIATDANTNDRPNALLLAGGTPWVVIGVVVVVFLVMLNVVFGRRCPQCKQRRALKKTGAAEKGGWFKAGREEWMCKFCGYRTWKAEQSSGCGGCGGCGGCLRPGVPDLLARLDLIIETKESLIVTDLKTARSRWSNDQAQAQAEQLLLYSALAKQLAPEKVLRLEFAIISKAKVPVTEQFPIEVVPQRVERTKLIMERVWRAIEAGHFFPSPSPMSCPSCPFRGPCQAWPG